MEREELVRRFQAIKVWKRHGVSAPHKPLLVLYAIGALLWGKSRLLPFTHIDEHLGFLLREFGSENSGENAYIPFWRLQRDQLWVVTDACKIRLTSKKDPYISDLIKYDVSGGFNVQIFSQLRTDSDFAFEIAQMMLDRHFSAQSHAKVLYWTWIKCMGPIAN